MDHEGSSVGVGQSARPADGRARDQEAGRSAAPCRDLEIGEVAEVRACRIVAAMLLAAGVPVPARAGKFRTFAQPLLVQVDAVRLL